MVCSNALTDRRVAHMKGDRVFSFDRSLVSSLLSGLSEVLQCFQAESYLAMKHPSKHEQPTTLCIGQNAFVEQILSCGSVMKFSP